MTMNEIKRIECKRLHEHYDLLTLPSGLTVYVFPKEMSVSYALFATKYGSLDNSFKLDSEDELACVPAGIAHFLEHKMFENPDGIDTFEKFSKTGAYVNAYTSFDKTAYLFSSTEKFYESLEILVDFVTHPYFTEQTVKKEQGIIGQEIRMYEDNPNSRLYFELMRAMYFEHDIRTEVCGTVESIAKITPELLYKCYNTFYNLSNMCLCVCGNVDTEKVMSVLEKCLPKTQPQNIVRVYKEDKPEVKLARTEVSMQVSRPQFAVGVKDPNYFGSAVEMAKRFLGMRILNEVLFSQSTDFYERLYSEGKLNSNFSYAYDNGLSFGYNMIGGECENPDDFMREFENYIEQCKSSPLDNDAFIRGKRAIFSDIVKIFDSTEEIANELISYAFMGIDILDTPDIVSGIDREYVENLLHTAFKKEYYSLAIISPIKSKGEKK